MKVEHSILIHAPREVVWAVTEDIERWPQWTPTTESVHRIDQGPFQVGSVARIKQPQLPETQWRVTHLTPREQFTWETRVRGMHIVATHRLASTDSGTHNLLRLEMHGFLALLLWPCIRSSVRRSLEKENTGLKQRCETLHQGD